MFDFDGANIGLGFYLKTGVGLSLGAVNKI